MSFPTPFPPAPDAWLPFTEDKVPMVNVAHFNSGDDLAKLAKDTITGALIVIVPVADMGPAFKNFQSKIEVVSKGGTMSPHTSSYHHEFPF